MPNQLYLWVVEIRDDGQWRPTVGAKLNREEARFELRKWQQHNPDDLFRLRRYYATPH